MLKVSESIMTLQWQPPAIDKEETLSQNVLGELTQARFTDAGAQDTETTSFQGLLPVLRKDEPHFEQRKGNYIKVSRRFGKICFKVF